MIDLVDRSLEPPDPRQLAALAAVARAGTFRRGAEELGCSQAAVSARIAALEAALGARLLERRSGARRVAPTPAGEAVLRLCETIRAATAGARAELAALAAGRAVLRVGVFQSAATLLLPGAMRHLRAGGEAVDVRLEEAADPDALLERLRSGRLDAAFASARPAGPWHAEPVLEDTYLLAVGADHPLASRASVAPAEIARLPLIGYRSARAEHGPLVHLPAATPATVVFRTDDDLTVLSLVAAGIGVAVLPALVLRARPAGVVAVPIAPALPARSLSLVWPSAHPGTPALAAFVDAVRVSARALTAGAPADA